jgi:hypothetical protein
MTKSLTSCAFLNLINCRVSKRSAELANLLHNPASYFSEFGGDACCNLTNLMPKTHWESPYLCFSFFKIGTALAISIEATNSARQLRLMHHWNNLAQAVWNN